MRYTIYLIFFQRFCKGWNVFSLVHHYLLVKWGEKVPFSVMSQPNPSVFSGSNFEFLFTLQIDVKPQLLRLSRMYKTFVQLEDEWGNRASGDMSRMGAWSAAKQNAWHQGMGKYSPSLCVWMQGISESGCCGFVEDHHFQDLNSLMLMVWCWILKKILKLQILYQ